jgi:hypothetical protein
MVRERSDHQAAVRITTAAESREADIAARQRRYVFSMSVRTLCFVGAILASLAGLNWLWPILIVGALVLPYVAVVMANATSRRADGFALLGERLGRPELGSGSEAVHITPKPGNPRS